MSSLPPSLRDPAITRLIHRATQLRTAAPAVSYWLEYHALDQIISRSLHTADEDSLAWTTTLMDRLETTKNEHADDDAFTDDDAGRAVVEDFANKAFERGEKVLRANRVTKQTADTFDAAATFLGLPAIWSPIDEPTRKKILFCKWNASRILKAIRNGEDPNESNPQLEPEEPPTETSADADAELEAGLAAAAAETAAREAEYEARPRPVTVEDVGDPEIELPSNFLPSVPSDVRPREFAPLEDHGVPSPLSTTDETWPQNTTVSRDVSPAVSPALPPAPAINDLMDLENTKPTPPPVFRSAQSSVTPKPTPPPFETRSPPPAAPPPARATPVAKFVPVSNADELDLAKAQKHAKWAISALNFEDVGTAVQELRNALRTLGAE